MAVATSFALPNYSGMLFVKGKHRTPFSTLIGARPMQTNHVEFAVGQTYDAPIGSQPEISETASLTAPEPSFVTRTQNTNVTQIFQETVAVSYGKMSNMGTLSGLNAANQEANPADELAFQIARTMEKIAMQVEYTLINGVYVKANADNVANKTRGILAAIPASNTIDLQSTDQAPVALTYDTVAEALALIHDQGGDTTDVILGVNATTLLQLNWDARKNNMTIVPASRNVNGLAIDTVITALGTVAVTLIDSLPDGTALLFNPNVCAPVFQPVPEKGNFFLEPLAKTGAADKYQIFGQLGLDHGPSFYHAKITGITTKKPSELSE